MKESHLWNFILHNIRKDNNIILIAVVHHENGSPGKEGFKMAVSSNGDFTGSVGGGIMEYNILNTCKEFFKAKQETNRIEKLFHNRKSGVRKSGLICAGSQTNFMISLSKKDEKKISEIVNYISLYKPGKLLFSDKGIDIVKNKINDIPYKFTFTDESNWNYEETIGLKNFVFIVGGGHVGAALSRLMTELDFHVTVYDDRKDLKLIMKNIYADKFITAPYGKLGKYIKEGNQTYVVILTKSYLSDKESMMQVINKKVRYTGIMGTKVKIKKIFNEAVKEGADRNRLKIIHAPVGLDINSDTPEEIAVSIAAEIIKIKNS
ncbi:MAG: XdhC family protein [Ignavibacteria bacterium]|nr:XdhC family protein [Ignavibacteria bacterium]